jgi:hypothetical protein
MFRSFEGRPEFGPRWNALNPGLNSRDQIVRVPEVPAECGEAHHDNK